MQFICGLPLSSSTADQPSDNCFLLVMSTYEENQLQVIALALGNHSLKRGSASLGVFSGHISFSFLGTALFCSGLIARDKHVLADNNQQP